ncbi:hypothetical protein FDP41_012070 [Naegleria fowleri]|uniref:RGS domain-containing protein n=1 Tax=Naegleria fowleri TaxID=5763 RepID=A0A6A5CAB4_NAEFO|nr:uncharacterized protein FDP41_012070 [Naegleria fowleri]KAF0982209.1 hypothetical protein FDP41_012070 [Naegleria fowleri]
MSTNSIPQANDHADQIHSFHSVDPSSVESTLKQMFPKSGGDDIQPNNIISGQRETHDDANVEHKSETNPFTIMATKTPTQKSVYELSCHHYVLLIFRRFVKYEGCALCNRRMYQILEMYRSLKQLNVIPIVVYPEEEKTGEEFFNSFDIREIKEMMRVADPHQVYAEQFNVYFERKFPLAKMATHLIPGLMNAYKQGFKQPLRTLSSYDGNSFFIKPAMFIIKNGKIVKSLRHDYADPCPDIIKEIILNTTDLSNQEQNNTGAISRKSDTDDTSHNSSVTTDQFQEKSIPSKELATDQEIAILSKEEELALTLQTTLQNEEQFLSFFSKPSPRYRITKVNHVATLQEISNEMKAKEEKERNEKAKLLLEKMETSSPMSCLGNSQQELPNNTNNMNASLDLMTVLQTGKYRKYFKIFSYKEYNSENIEFWEEVNLKYKPIAEFDKKEDAYQVAMKIGRLFLFDESALTFINTTDHLRNKVKNNITDVFIPPTQEDSIPSLETKQEFNEKAPSIFDCVLSEMYASLMKDMFIRFSTSDLFKEMKAPEARRRK